MLNEHGGIECVNETNILVGGRQHNEAVACAIIALGSPKQYNVRRFILKPVYDEELLPFCDVPRWRD
jgi:hypothetical protein